MGGRCVEQYRPLPNGLLTSRQGHRRSAHCLPYCEGRHCRHLGPHSSDQLKYRLHLEKSRVCISSEELVTTDTLVSPTLNPIVARPPILSTPTMTTFRHRSSGFLTSTNTADSVTT